LRDASTLVAKRWADKAGFLSAARLLTASVIHAHKEEPAAWVVTLLTNAIRLNVGQVALLTIWPEQVHIYYRKPARFRLPSGANELRTTDPSIYSDRAIPEDIGIILAPLGAITALPSELLSAHFAAISSAAAAKRRSPFRRHLSESVLRYVEDLTKTTLPRPDYEAPSPEEAVCLPRNGGQGFGDPDRNAAVEKAAVDLVIEKYRADGWIVTDRQNDKCAYDLLCERGRFKRLIEVKGTQGDAPIFFMTRGELDLALSSDEFRLAVVLGALSASPRLREWTSPEFARRFTPVPIQYRVTPHARPA
jgi:hypothetical protein